jgi:ATP-dependent RNA helicase SUPV3L1/SUV3
LKGCALVLCRKIKRVVFEAVHKFSGTHDIRLSDSQLKQIAGRAGRYGLHGDGTPGGFTTTLHSQDLPVLRKAIASPIQPLSHAYINIVDWNTSDLVDCLPIRSPLLTIFETYHYVARMRWPYEMELTNSVRKACDFVDTIAGEASLADKILVMSSPISWRDPDIVEIFSQFYRQYLNHMRVNLVECLQHGPLDQLADVEADMSHGPPRSSQQTLRTLESLHKVLVFYMWMHMRSPVAWGDHLDASNLKERTERALDWSLQGISQSRRPLDVVALRRRQEANSITYLDRQHFIRKRSKVKGGA